jgi:acetyl-CoA synthetase
VSEGSLIKTQAEYEAIWSRSVLDPEKFWGEAALKELHWFRPFDVVRAGDFGDGDVVSTCTADII